MFYRNRNYLQHGWLRDLLQEHHVLPNDLIQPLFLHSKIEKDPILNLDNQFRLGLDDAIFKIKNLKRLGCKAVAIFPVIDDSLKDKNGSYAINKENFLYKYINEIKSAVPDIGIICDVALDPYTSHGHDGVLDQNGNIDNDLTIEFLAQQALMLADASADIIAPSDMMDGRVLKIKEAFDNNSHKEKLICSYSAKFSSSFYGPFRDAVGSKNNLGKADKKTYQLNPANSQNAFNKTRADLDEGADIIIVKPATVNLDIIKFTALEFKKPIFAYHVSGEYQMLKIANSLGILNFDDAYEETLLSLKRAGSSAIITYGTEEYLRKRSLNI